MFLNGNVCSIIGGVPLHSEIIVRKNVVASSCVVEGGHTPFRNQSVKSHNFQSRSNPYHLNRQLDFKPLFQNRV